MAAAVAVVIVGIAAAGCTTTSSAAASSTASPVDSGLAPPLSTSVAASGATWATVPMGHLDQPLNTFWQLLELPAGAGEWTNQVQATAVATNGGIVLASSPSGSLVAAVRPSNLLTYSPIVITEDAGRSWSQGVLDAAIVDRPGVLTTGPDRSFALVGGRSGARLVQSTGSLEQWQTLSTQRALAHSPGGRTCRLTSVTSVAQLNGSPVVGASCARPGTVGVLEPGPGGWQLAGPVSAGSLGDSRIAVLELWSTADGLTGLLSVSGGSDQDLMVASSADGRHWVLSAKLSLPDGEKLASAGVTAAGGLFVLLSGDNADRLDVVNGGGWSALPAPPAGSATVAFPMGGPPSALVPHETTLDVWSLTSGSWSPSQRMDVHIEFGSSS